MKTRTMRVAMIWPVNMSADTERSSGCARSPSNVEEWVSLEGWRRVVLVAVELDWEREVRL